MAPSPEEETAKENTCASSEAGPQARLTIRNLPSLESSVWVYHPNRVKR
jgi:hypothetical protein